MRDRRIIGLGTAGVQSTWSVNDTSRLKQELGTICSVHAGRYIPSYAMVVSVISVRSGAASAVRRIVRPSTRGFIAAPSRCSGDVQIQANDPSPKPAPQNVSETNAVEIDAAGARDAPLQELPEDAEKRRVMQAPNRATKWSPSQQPREMAMKGPRFEQIIMEWQVSLRCAICLR